MKRLLIVDDDEGMRALFRMRLQEAYEIVETGEPERAFLLIVQNKPDAILMDLNMPKLSGFELCRTLSSFGITQHIPVFVVSGQSARNKTFCKSLGASGYFEKPIDFVKLKGELEIALSSRSSGTEWRAQFKIVLKLKGKADNGEDFEIRATAENANGGGFLCTSAAPPGEGSVVEVFLGAGEEHYLGRAHTVREKNANPTDHSFRIQFVETADGAEEKALQRSLS